MKGINSKAIGGMNRRNRDEIIGKTITVTGGEYKGHRGRVTQADDKQVIVELSTKNKKIPIDRSLILELSQE